jgi:hypothetical protein
MDRLAGNDLAGSNLRLARFEDFTWADFQRRKDDQFGRLRP